MNASDHLRRYPNARPSTLAYLIRRDQKTDQLRREINDAKGWRFPKWWRALANVLRGDRHGTS